jgi:hypothetical protein
MRILRASKAAADDVYLVDTDAISELRKADPAHHPGVHRFFADARRDALDLYLP